MKWVHRRYSGVKASLQAASAAFICKKCQGETSPSIMAAEGLVVGREKCDIVDSFCYLGDMLSMEGDADAAVTVRVRCAFQQEINKIKNKNIRMYHPWSSLRKVLMEEIP